MKILKVWLSKVQGLTGRRAQVALPTMVAFWSLDSTKKAKCPFRTI